MKTYLSSILILWLTLPVTAQTVKPTLEVVAKLPVRPGNVAVSEDGRVFATIHPLGSSELQLIEVKTEENYLPYPSASLQKNGNLASDVFLDTPLGLTFDKKGFLWVIDMGQNLGKTRIWKFDIKHNKVVQKIDLPADIAPKGSFIQDIAVDEVNGWVYLADIANPGIIAVNVKDNTFRRFGGHPSLQAEDIDMVIDGKVIYFGGKPARVAINPITISADKNTLYFGAMNGTRWYSVNAKLFRSRASDAEIGNSIKAEGEKPISDGAATDALGNHYFTNLPGHSISHLYHGKLTDIITDSHLLWPDNVAVHKGYIYISVNQLNTTPAFTGNLDTGHPPYYIYRFKLRE